MRYNLSTKSPKYFHESEKKPENFSFYPKILGSVILGPYGTGGWCPCHFYVSLI